MEAVALTEALMVEDDVLGGVGGRERTEASQRRRHFEPAIPGEKEQRQTQAEE